MAQLGEILKKTVSQSPEDQKLALQFLEQAVLQNFSEFVKQLSDLLRGANSEDFVRQAAGLQLKNVLVAKDENVKAECLQRWLSLPADAREYVKNNVIETLGTEKTRPSIAAQCVASIACAEIPQKQWLESISRLMKNVTQPESTEMLKESSLEALGYICQDINALVLGELANQILTAIVHGMKKQEPSNHVRLAATNALFNSLEFTRTNFENENERHVIMQVVCEATQSTDTQVKVAALQCLVKVMSLYYEHMEHYMGPALFAITIDAMKSQSDDVCLQGIEFWSNVCEEEIELSVEAEEALQEGRPPEHVSKHYAKGAMQHLVPIMTEALAKQEEGDDDDEWNPAKAASVCLMLLAQCVGDDVVETVLPFITENIGHQNWRYRDAAIMAFGSVLDGPDPEKLKPLVLQALPMLLKLMTDEQTVVRDTSAWTISKVCEICQDVVIQPEILQPLLPVLSQGLLQEARVAANVCWALSSLAHAAYENASEQSGSADETGQPDTYILTPCFDAIVEALLKATDRPDGHVRNLRIAAYEALMEMIKNSPKDCYPSVQKTTLIILQKLEQLLAMEGTIQSSSEKSQFHDLQSLLCATLQSVLRKMKSEDAPLISDTVMGALLQIMAHSAGKEGGGVMEDALMAVSTLVEVLGQGFVKYMDAFKPYEISGLKNHDEYQVCFAAVGLVGDLARGLETEIMPHLDEFMALMIEILQDQKMDKSVKPVVLSTFGDIALSIGPQFTRYFGVVLATLFQASQAKVEDKNDFDAIDYLTNLRGACLEAYTGILQGLKDHGNNNSQNSTDELKQLEPHVNNMLGFLDSIAIDNHQTDEILANAAGLVGDLISTFGGAILPAVEKDSVNSLLMKGRRSKVQKTRTLAGWATKEIRKAKNTVTA